VQAGSTGSKTGVGSGTVDVSVLNVVGNTEVSRSNTLGPGPVIRFSEDAADSMAGVSGSTELARSIDVGSVIGIDGVGSGGMPRISGAPNQSAVGATVSASRLSGKGALVDASTSRGRPVTATWSGSLASVEAVGDARRTSDCSTAADSAGIAGAKPRDIGVTGSVTVGSKAAVSECVFAFARLTIRGSSEMLAGVAVSGGVDCPSSDTESSVDVPRGGAGHG